MALFQGWSGSSPAAKETWSGGIISVQPRIRLTRSFDQRDHSYLGYALRLRGRIAHVDREFTVGVGEAAHAKHGFRVGDQATGNAAPVADPRLETVEFYKASGLKIVARGGESTAPPPPWHGLAVPLATYRARGHRRLAVRTYEAECFSCVWGCKMAVEMIVDQWNPRVRKYREETFCYGPLSCPRYRPGPTRKVPGRKGMSWEEDDWVDAEDVSHRGPDD